MKQQRRAHHENRADLPGIDAPEIERRIARRAPEQKKQNKLKQAARDADKETGDTEARMILAPVAAQTKTQAGARLVEILVFLDDDDVVVHVTNHGFPPTQTQVNVPNAMPANAIPNLRSAHRCAYSAPMTKVSNPATTLRWIALLLTALVASAHAQVQPIGKLPGIKPAFKAEKKTAPEPAKPLGPSLEEIQSAAEKGLPKPQFQLGLKHLYGEGVEEDIKTASIWITKAAEGGYPDAQYFLGIVNSVDAPKEALAWYAKAGEQGHVKAASRLGDIYSEGKLVDADYFRAYRWYQQAAEKGDTHSQFALGSLYENGLGVDQNFGEAAKWYTKAANQREPQAQVNLGNLYLHGLGVKQNMPEAYKWFRQAAYQNQKLAYVKMGLCYERGYGVTQDFDEALRWYLKGADRGDMTCQANLGRFFEEGLGVPKNPTRAADYYRQAAEQGEIFAQLSLGSMYRAGNGVQKDLVEAYKWLQLASEKGHGAAVRDLLQKVMTPEQVAEARKRALEFHAAAEKKSKEPAQSADTAQAAPAP